MYNIRTIHLSEVDSTNKYAKNLIPSTSLPVLIYADGQTAGRGRLGRTFVSNIGKGIYMSILFKPTFDLSLINKITAYTSTIVSRVIDETASVNTQIKWVNDIYLNNKKVCGILTESVIKNNECYVIVGIGINVLKQEFSDELKNIVTTLEDETNIKYDNKTIIDMIVKKFFDNIGQIVNKEYIKDYKNKSCVIGKNVEVKLFDKIINGIAVDIDEDGELVVSAEDTIYKLYSGEITKLSICDE